MKIKVELISENPVILPAYYSKYLQALIYNLLDKFDSDWLHERGFTFEKRSFKLFTFSGILEKGMFRRKEKLFIFPNNISFYIASPVDWILEQLASNILKNEKVRLENNTLFVSSVSVLKKETVNSDEIKIYARTPIENHSTLTKADGKKMTYYYTPYEKEFSELSNKNLQKKWTALFKEECPYNMSIRPLFKGSRNEKVRIFPTKNINTVIKGWTGRFELKGNPEFLEFALDAGLGSRNSQGFGLIELAKEREYRKNFKHDTKVVSIL